MPWCLLVLQDTEFAPEFEPELKPEFKPEFETEFESEFEPEFDAESGTPLATQEVLSSGSFLPAGPPM